MYFAVYSFVFVSTSVNSYIMSKPTSLDKGKGKNSTRDVPGGRPPNDPDMNLEVHRARQPLAAHHSGISSSEEAGAFKIVDKSLKGAYDEESMGKAL
ncbi:hypothetical protein Tco_1295552 [Tanacetum coccineum]